MPSTLAAFESEPVRCISSSRLILPGPRLRPGPKSMRRRTLGLAMLSILPSADSSARRAGVKQAAGRCRRGAPDRLLAATRERRASTSERRLYEPFDCDRLVESCVLVASLGAAVTTAAGVVLAAAS